MKNLFVINPVAGKGKKSLAYIDFIKKECENKGVKYDIYITKSQGDATLYVRNYLLNNEESNVFACGGDGTLCEVVNGAYGFSSAKVGVIPLGSGNDFVRLFDNKENFFSIKRQLQGESEKVDLIKCENKFALSQCSVGFDAKVSLKQKSIKQLPFVSGELAFGISALSCLFGSYSDKYEIVIDDDKTLEGEYVLCLAANSKWYGGGFLSAPKAEINDGFIDLVLVKKPKSGIIELLNLLPKYKKGKHPGNRNIELLRCKKVVIKAQKQQAVNIDGECCAKEISEFNIVPSAIDFIVPCGSQKI